MATCGSVHDVSLAPCAAEVPAGIRVPAMLTVKRASPSMTSKRDSGAGGGAGVGAGVGAGLMISRDCELQMQRAAAARVQRGAISGGHKRAASLRHHPRDSP